MSASKQKGTRYEVAVVDYLDDRLPVTVERRALQGVHDRGDVAGIAGVVIEVKNHKALDLGAWMTEAEREADNDHGSLPVVAHKRRGKGDVAENYFTMPGWAFAELLNAWCGTTHLGRGAVS